VGARPVQEEEEMGGGGAVQGGDTTSECRLCIAKIRREIRLGGGKLMTIGGNRGKSRGYFRSKWGRKD